MCKKEAGKASGTQSAHPKARSAPWMMTVKVKAVTSGGARAEAQEPFLGVGASSCSGNQVPAPKGPMTSTVGRKGRLKTTRVGRSTEKDNFQPTAKSGPLLTGFLAQGERGWEDGWRGAQQSKLSKILKILPQPPAAGHMLSAGEGCLALYHVDLLLTTCPEPCFLSPSELDLPFSTSSSSVSNILVLLTLPAA
ncbi:hypothetical protein AAY473_037595, partial [Plecturocebus cupreus]